MKPQRVTYQATHEKVTFGLIALLHAVEPNCTGKCVNSLSASVHVTNRRKAKLTRGRLQKIATLLAGIACCQPACCELAYAPPGSIVDSPLKGQFADWSPGKQLICTWRGRAHQCSVIF